MPGSRGHRPPGNHQRDLHYAAVRLALRGQVLRFLLQEHGPLDRDGVLRGWLRLRHHAAAEKDLEVSRKHE